MSVEDGMTTDLGQGTSLESGAPPIDAGLNAGSNASGVPAADASLNEAVSIAAKNLGMSEDEAKNILESDPDYLDNISRANKLGKYKSSDADPSKQSPATASNPEDKSTVTDDKNPGEPAADSGNVEFEDNVIEGLTGADFSKIPAAAQEAIGNFYEKAQETTAKLTEAEARLNKLLSDPIAKARNELLESGSAPDKYDVRNLTQAEKQSIAVAIKQDVIEATGLDENDAIEVAAKVIARFEKSLEVAAKDMAQAHVNNILLERDTKQKLVETNKKGMSILLQEMGNLNPNLKFNETDIGKFYKGMGADGKMVYNESHPEIKKFKEFLEPVRDLFISKKMGYKDIVEFTDKFGIEALYASVAKQKGWPVAINTAQRDAKIANESRMNSLKKFLKSNSTGTLSTETSMGTSRDAAANLAASGGYDPVKLAQDKGYLARAIESKPGDVAHLEKITKLAEQGRKQLQLKK